MDHKRLNDLQKIHRGLQIYDITSLGNTHTIKLLDILNHFDNIKTNIIDTTQIYYKDKQLIYSRCDVLKKYFVSNSLYLKLDREGYGHPLIMDLFKYMISDFKDYYKIEILYMDSQHNYYNEHKKYMI
jgi:cAMP phosphodiesterase